MQIDRLARDSRYAELQTMKGGALFQLWTEGWITPAEAIDMAPAIAADIMHVTHQQPMLPLDTFFILAEIKNQLRTEGYDVSPYAAYVFGLMHGIGEERARRTGRLRRREADRAASEAAKRLVRQLVRAGVTV
jgi:hypothetical protein